MRGFFLSNGVNTPNHAVDCCLGGVMNEDDLKYIISLMDDDWKSLFLENELMAKVLLRRLNELEEQYEDSIGYLHSSKRQDKQETDYGCTQENGSRGTFYRRTKEGKEE